MHSALSPRFDLPPRTLGFNLGYEISNLGMTFSHKYCQGDDLTLAGDFSDPNKLRTQHITCEVKTRNIGECVAPEWAKQEMQ